MSMTKKESQWFNPKNPQTGTGKSYPKGVKDGQKIQPVYRKGDGTVISRQEERTQ